MWNREHIPASDYCALANCLVAAKFNPDVLCDFSTVKTAANRVLVAEIIAAACNRGFMVGLYHSLNNWHDQPDAVAALEDKISRSRKKGPIK